MERQYSIQQLYNLITDYELMIRRYSNVLDSQHYVVRCLKREILSHISRLRDICDQESTAENIDYINSCKYLFNTYKDQLYMYQLTGQTNTK